MVGMAMIIALELHEDVPTCISAGHSNGRHRGLGAAVDKAQPLHRGNRLAHLLGESGLGFTGYAITAAVTDGIDGGLAHPVIVMSQDKDAPRHTEVDDSVVIDIREISTLGLFHEERGGAYAAECPDGTVHPAGDHLLRPFERSG